MPNSPHSCAARGSRWLEPLLHLGFALTGVGTVLLGCILPRLSVEWHLRDQDAGVLLLIQFAASASGSLAVRRRWFKTLSLGYVLLGAGGFGIFLVQRQPLAVLAAMFAVFGLGLGLAMTSTNMLIGLRHADHRGSALALLNFSWSAGAVACPLLAAEFLRHSSGGHAFAWLGLAVWPFALLPILAGARDGYLPAGLQTPAGNWQETTTIAYFALLAFLYVGIEATLGNWISSFATRTTKWHLAGGGLAVSAFWAAFLVGRATTPAMLTRVRERALYYGAAVATLASISLLLSAHSALAVVAGASLAGFSLGPLFPLTLSLFMAAIGASRRAGWVFAIAGLGGAVLSWLTGEISSHTGSLRLGLLVPICATLLMLAMMTQMRVHARPQAAVSGSTTKDRG